MAERVFSPDRGDYHGVQPAPTVRWCGHRTYEAARKCSLKRWPDPKPASSKDGV